MRMIHEDELFADCIQPVGWFFSSCVHAAVRAILAINKQTESLRWNCRLDEDYYIIYAIEPAEGE